MKATHKEYAAACDELLRQVDAWFKDNPDERVNLTWKVPANVMISATITDAIFAGFVTLNGGGTKLVSAVRFINGAEVSFAMFRAVINHRAGRN